MTNYEKYQKQIINIFKEGNCIAVKDGKPVDCSSIRCGKCNLYVLGGNCKPKLGEWLESEYVEPTVDWSKVPVDAKVLVSTDEVVWKKRHFARVEDGMPLVWADGQTSWSADRADYIAAFKYIKLYEEGEQNEVN